MATGGAGGAGNNRPQLNFSQERLDDFTERLQNIAALTDEANEFLNAASLDTAETNVQMAELEAAGISAQLDINYLTNVANLEADLANLQGRATFLLASKTQEISTLIAQFREKSLQLFIQIMEQRTNNAWNRVKTLANGFKF